MGPLMWTREAVKAGLKESVLNVCSVGGIKPAHYMGAYNISKAGLILGHSGGGSQWAFSTYGLQVLTPDRLRGRIAGIDYSLYFLMNTISTLMIGYLATIYGVLFVFKLFPVIGFLFGFVWYLSTRNIWKNLDKS